MWPSNLAHPEFLATYAVAVVASSVLGLVIFHAWRGELDRPALTGGFDAPTIGYARRGMRGLLEVLLASLHRRGLVGPGQVRGNIIPTGTCDAGLVEIERSIFEDLVDHGSRTVPLLQAWAEPLCQSIHRDLVARGAVYPAPLGQLIRWTTLAPSLLVLSVGSVKVCVLLLDERCGLFPVLVLAATAAAIVWLAPRLPVRTPAFDAALAQLRVSSHSLYQRARGDDAAALSPADAARVVSLWGVAASRFTVVGKMLASRPARPEGQGGWDGGGG